MKILIAIPTVSAVDASFFSSVLAMQYDDGNQYSFGIKSNSLIYNARSEFAMDAVRGNFDAIVFLDSDMVMEQNTVKKLARRLQEDETRDMISGIYFRRNPSAEPVILKELDWYEDELLGAMDVAEVYEDYPKGKLFRIAGCGMGCCIMRVKLILDIAQNFRIPPFTPMPRLSEDYAFCWRAKKLGKKLFCDSSIRVGHAGLKVYSEKDWEIAKTAKDAKEAKEREGRRR